MSTYWYLECMDHDPPLKSFDEVTQHTDDVYYRRAVELVHQRPLDPDWENTYYRDGSADTYFEGHARAFLVQHPQCTVGLINEYGERRAAGGDRPHLQAMLKALEDDHRRAVQRAQQFADQQEEARKALAALDEP